MLILIFTSNCVFATGRESLQNVAEFYTIFETTCKK